MKIRLCALYVGLCLGVATSSLQADFANSLVKKLGRVCCKLKELDECSCKCISILQDDFKDESGALTKTLEITKPGNYCLAEDIPFEPLERRNHCIVIKASDVTLDLCGHRLCQVNKLDVPQIIGVVVETGNHNVTIIGSFGTICDFSQLGIQVKAGTKFIQIGDASSRLDLTGNGGGTPRTFVDGLDIFYEGGLQVGDSIHLGRRGFPVTENNEGLVILFNAGNGGSLKPEIVENLTMRNVYSDANTFGGWFGNIDQATLRNGSFSCNLNTRVSGTSLLEPALDSITTYGGGLWGVIDAKDGDTGWVDVSFDSYALNENKAITAVEDQFVVSFGLFVSSVHKGTTALNSEFNSNVATAESDPVQGPILKNRSFKDFAKSLSSAFAECNVTQGQLLKKLSSEGFELPKASTTVKNNVLQQGDPLRSISFVAGASVGGGECTKFENCQFCCNRATFRVRGFTQNINGLRDPGTEERRFVQGRSLVIHKSVASNNEATSLPTEFFADVSGFRVAGVLGATLTDIVAEHNRAVLDAPFFIGVALGLSINSVENPENLKASNIAIYGLHASNNFTTGVGTVILGNAFISRSAGAEVFDPFNALLIRNVSFIHATITHNVNPAGPAAGREEVGINLFGNTVTDDLTSPLMIIDKSCISDHTTAGVKVVRFRKTTVIDSIITQNRIGVLLTESPCSVVKRNVFLHNFFTAVVDTGDIPGNTQSTSLVAQNKGFNNGDGLAVGCPGYNVAYANNFPFVRNGFLGSPGGFPKDAQICDNVHIVKGSGTPDACIDV